MCRLIQLQRFFVLLSVLGIPGVAAAQATRTETTNASAPGEDAKPNSAAVPEVYALSGQFERVLVLRLKYQADLLAGLERMVKDNNIRNAVILSGIGSVRSYHYHVVSNGAFPSKNMYVKNADGPADITSMNGYVIDGRVHAHITMSDADKAFGGHLEPGTNVFTFAIVTLGVLKDGIDLKRVDDKTYR
jgi:predicted DNA-binding protein with PD1-like motif